MGLACLSKKVHANYYCKNLRVGGLLQLQVCLEEVEEEGLLVSWMFSQHPLLTFTLTPRQRVQREVREGSPEPHKSL